MTIAAEAKAARALEIKIALQSGPRVAPSRPDTWPQMWAGDRAPNSRWSVKQLARLKVELDLAKGADSRLAHAVVAKLREPERVEAWKLELSDGSTIDCPLLARTKDRRRVLIITPGGDKVWREATHD